MTKIKKENLLKVSLKDNKITISIGLDALAFAVESGPDWSEEFRVDSSDNFKKFGESFLQYLEHEEEDGTNPIHRLFDSVAEEALNQGCEGFVNADGSHY